MLRMGFLNNFGVFFFFLFVLPGCFLVLGGINKRWLFIYLFFIFLWVWLFINLFSFVLWLPFMFEVNLFIFNMCMVFDMLTMVFIVLNSLLISISILLVWKLTYRLYEFIYGLLLTWWCLNWLFCCYNLFFFYVFFEVLLIPFLLFIGVWGSRDRRVVAAYQFFFFTLLGSLLIMLGLLVIYYHVGSLNLDILIRYSFSYERQCILWLLFFFGFGVKIPIFPVHLWLPEAHVEASTVGSVLLAGILLKLGVFAFFRFLIPMFPLMLIFCVPIVIIFGTVSMLYCSIVGLYQFDLKKIVAYASIVHMNFMLIGLFSGGSLGYCGCLFLMISHAFVSGSLFILVGCLYDRLVDRTLFQVRGIASIMPLYSVVLFILLLANCSFPGTSNFIGECLVFFGLGFSALLQVFCLVSFFFGTIYSLYLFSRVCFGSLVNCVIRNFCDLTMREFSVLMFLLVIILILGMRSNYYLWLSEEIWFGSLYTIYIHLRF